MTDGPDITKYVVTINLLASSNLREKYPVVVVVVVVVVVALFLLFSKLSQKPWESGCLLLNKFDDVSSLIYQLSSGVIITAEDKTRFGRHEIKLKPQAKQPPELICRYQGP